MQGHVASSFAEHFNCNFCVVVAVKHNRRLSIDGVGNAECPSQFSDTPVPSLASSGVGKKPVRTRERDFRKSCLWRN